jgi:hypothetical protein
MSINEYAADAADEWLPLRIAGSLDNGATDAEYTPIHEPLVRAGYNRRTNKTVLYVANPDGETATIVSGAGDRIICAGEEGHAELLRLIESVAELATGNAARITEMEKSMAGLSVIVADACKTIHRLLNAEPDSDDGLTAAYMLGAYDGKHGTGTGTDYAHIPLAEWQDITTELEWLRLQRPTQDEDGVLIDNEAWAVLQRDAAIGASVPWEALEWVWAGAASVNAAPSPDIEAVKAWIDAHAPKEAAE